MTVVNPGLRHGTVTAPVSKSHLHRLLIASFLGGARDFFAPQPGDSQDIVATRRCLKALGEAGDNPVLDCGESGSTLRFLMPVAAALGKTPTYLKAGRLASRPVIEYPTLTSGVHELAGNVSSQYVTGLLFALPLLPGPSEIRFSSPLESRGYVDMTLDVLRGAGIEIVGTEDGGYHIPGGQKYSARPDVSPETDWSGAAFWICANSFGNRIEVAGLSSRSLQPDAAVVGALWNIGGEIEISQFPDSFPALAVAAAAAPSITRFLGTRRLRIKESDRVAAMADVLARLGVESEARENSFIVHGTGSLFKGGAFSSFGDHRIAMATAIAATRASSPVEIDDTSCAAKSYPEFFNQFAALGRIG